MNVSQKPNICSMGQITSNLSSVGYFFLVTDRYLIQWRTIVPLWDSWFLTKYDNKSTLFFVTKLIVVEKWPTRIFTSISFAYCCTEGSVTECKSKSIIYQSNCFTTYFTITIEITEINPVFSEWCIKFEECNDYLMIVVIFTEKKIKTLLTDT